MDQLLPVSSPSYMNTTQLVAQLTVVIDSFAVQYALVVIPLWIIMFTLIIVVCMANLPPGCAGSNTSPVEGCDNQTLIPMQELHHRPPVRSSVAGRMIRRLAGNSDRAQHTRMLQQELSSNVSRTANSAELDRVRNEESSVRPIQASYAVHLAMKKAAATYATIPAAATAATTRSGVYTVDNGDEEDVKLELSDSPEQEAEPVVTNQKAN
jgi:hypothetical protein